MNLDDGTQHESVVSVLPAGGGGRVCHEGMEDSTGSADRSIKKCGTCREVPTDHEAPGQKNATTAAAVRCPKSQTCDVQEPRGACPG